MVLFVPDGNQLIRSVLVEPKLLWNVSLPNLNASQKTLQSTNIAFKQTVKQ